MNKEKINHIMMGPFVKKISASLQDYAIILKERGIAWIDSASLEKKHKNHSANFFSDEHSYSVLAFDPIDQIVFDDKSIPKSFLQFFNQFSFAQKNPTTKINFDINFYGGWIGYLAYEAYQYNSLIPLRPSHSKSYPLAIFRYYDTFFYTNHKSDETYFISFSSQAKEKLAFLDDALNKLRDEKNLSFSVEKLAPVVSKRKYDSRFKEIKKALSDGDYFELNYTIEFQGLFLGSPMGLFCRMRNVIHAPMMAYLDFPEVKILSSSPERFFNIQKNKLFMHPIKGTISRGKSKEEDQDKIETLKKSQKDNAELLMVTDMLRNDMGRLCVNGSVCVEELAKLHSFSHYHHLISKIHGFLKPEITLQDVFEALFPCGSITGAPKIQVMIHTDKIEKRARGIYTGAIGLISSHGYVDFNIPIRTVTIEKELLTYGSGGGIVIDSECDDEYQECLLKTAGLFEAILCLKQ